MFKLFYETLFNWENKKPELTYLPVAENLTTSEYTSEHTRAYITKWTPDDKLQQEYNKASRIVGCIPAINKRIIENTIKIDTLNQQAKKYIEKEDLTPFDKFTILELKQDIIKEEDKISAHKLELANAEAYTNNPVFEKWGEYMSKAEKFIHDNPRLRGFIGVNDILNSEGIFIKCKALIDSAKLTVRDEDQINKLAIISIFFDLKQVHEQARGRHLKDFSLFMNNKVKDERLTIFDKLDIEALGTSAKFITMENSMENSMLQDHSEDHSEDHIEQSNV